jgi:hypothetical protein
LHSELPKKVTWQKRLFIAVVVVMATGMVVASWDIARRTTFPGSKGQLQERIRKQFSGKNSVDSVGKKPSKSLDFSSK